MEDFSEGEDDKHCHKGRGEVFAEDCHGEEGLHHCLGDLVVDSFYFAVSEGAQEQVSEEFVHG